VQTYGNNGAGTAALLPSAPALRCPSLCVEVARAVPSDVPAAGAVPTLSSAGSKPRGDTGAVIAEGNGGEPGM